MNTRPTLTLLDLRLLFSRLPVLLLVPGMLAVAAIWLLALPPQSPALVTDAAVDPARIIAAQRNFRIPPGRSATRPGRETVALARR